jgi:hypothetical protein
MPPRPAQSNAGACDVHKDSPYRSNENNVSLNPYSSMYSWYAYIPVSSTNNLHACPFQFSDSHVITFSEEWYSVQADNLELNETNCIMRGVIIFTFHCDDRSKEDGIGGVFITHEKRKK